MTSRRARKQTPSSSGPVEKLIPLGGRFRPLTAVQCDEIVQSALAILEQVGMATPENFATKACEQGAKRRDDGRITFPKAMVESAIARAASSVELPGFNLDQSIQIGGGNVHIGSAGAAVQVLDAEKLEFRDSTLDDLYRLMRILGVCDHIHYGIRPVVARDMQSPYELDVNTAFACLKATDKPIGVSFDSADHVESVVQLFDVALGQPGRFQRQPFCFAVIVHAVSPLRYADEGIQIMQAAIEQGMALQICTAAQAGATSPVTLAGALAQGLAETLAGLMVVDVIKPGFPCIFAFLPFISDLRTGAMTGGSGESAVANAAAAQLLLDLGLPSTVSAGMTDAKLVDAQSGYEKGYTISLAAHAGADMINLSVGMLGSIMAASPEALVIDNDMCGAILRSVRGVEFSTGAIDLDMIENVVTGPGHYLGEAQTLELMKSEYQYPELGDRQAIADWVEEGEKTIWDRAVERVKEIEQLGPAEHLSAKAEAAIRQAFPIHLPEII